MPTQIATSSTADATATSGTPLVAVAPSDESINLLFFDSGNGGPRLATAQSPYTAWTTQGVGAASTRNSQVVIGHTGDDNLDGWVTSPSNGPYQFTATRSGNTWTVTMPGPVDIVYNASNSGNGVFAWEGKDQQGRLWAIGVDDVNATYQVFCDYYSSGWNSGGAAIEGLNLGEANRRGVAAAIIGNYLVVVYDSGAGGLHYLRIDVHAAALGAWSTAAAVGTVGDVTTSSVLSMAPIPGGATGMLVYSGNNGISALSYDANSDVWSAATVLSAAVNDKHPTLIPGGTGDVYAVWCKYSALNSYALVGELYNGAWSANVVTLEAAGSNVAWPNGGYLATGTKLALIWTQGTGAPYSVEFDTVAAPASGGTNNVTGSIVGGGLPSAAAVMLETGSPVGSGLPGASATMLIVGSILGHGLPFWSGGTIPVPLKAWFLSSLRLMVAFKRGLPMAQPNSTIDVIAAVTKTGSPVTDLTTVTCQVTFPDNSQSAYSLGSGIVNNSDGTYTLTYITKGAGTNTELWTFTATDGSTAQYRTFSEVAY